jgi:hypothetical protein
MGGWKSFFQLILSMNGRPLEVLPIPFSDPKEKFEGDFGYGGSSLHPKNGLGLTKFINLTFRCL